MLPEQTKTRMKPFCFRNQNESHFLTKGEGGVKKLLIFGALRATARVIDKHKLKGFALTQAEGYCLERFTQKRFEGQ